MGEFVAWIIGWDLVLDTRSARPRWRSPGASTSTESSSSWGSASPTNGAIRRSSRWDGVSGHHEHPGGHHPGLLSALLIRGTRESAFVNSLIVITKVTIVLMVIVIGWGFINPANHTPFIPPPTTYTTPQGVTHDYGGIMGILGAAGVVFFAFIGFDAVSTAAQETKNPKRDMPIGILGSLVVCTVLYVLFSYVLSGVATVEDFRTAGREASVAFAISTYMPATSGCRSS